MQRYGIRIVVAVLTFALRCRIKHGLRTAETSRDKDCADVKDAVAALLWAKDEDGAAAVTRSRFAAA